MKGRDTKQKFQSYSFQYLHDLYTDLHGSDTYDSRLTI